MMPLSPGAFRFMRDQIQARAETYSCTSAHIAHANAHTHTHYYVTVFSSELTCFECLVSLFDYLASLFDYITFLAMAC